MLAMRRPKKRLWGAVALGWVGALAACAPSMPRGFNSPEPGVRIDAIVEAARRGDPAAVPSLVRMLDSDDPATRLLAIRALERITGTTYGYDHSAPETERREAVRRWQDSGPGAVVPTGQEGTPGGPARQP